MAKKRDILDDFIDIQEDFRAVSNPLGNLADAIAIDPDKVKVWNPSDYKERPRVNSVRCLRSTSKDLGACTACLDVCPVGAIEFSGHTFSISDNCRKCGLCIAACPTESFGSKALGAKALYNKIARAASIHQDCYITCTRALGRLPHDNEIVLPCVGLISADLWFALLSDYDNLSVYLPLGICDRCRTTTGEMFLSEQIAQGEEWAGESVGLEVEESELNHEQRRSYKRSQFLSNMAQSGATMVGGKPVLAGAKAVAKKIEDHTRQVNELQRSLEKMTGGNSSLARRRTLTQRRELVMGALQKNPEPAQRMTLDFPECDSSLCTMCGDCVRACPTKACDIDRQGRLSVERAYCINCGVCARMCKEGAIKMRQDNADDLVIPDKNVEEVKKKLDDAKAATEKSKKMLKKGLDAIEKLADE